MPSSYLPNLCFTADCDDNCLWNSCTLDLIKTKIETSVLYVKRLIVMLPEYGKRILSNTSCDTVYLPCGNRLTAIDIIIDNISSRESV